MKYTRYDLKRKNSDGIVFIAVFIGILILAFFIGSIASKIVYRNNKAGTISTKVQNQDKSSDKTVSQGGTTKFIAIQGGMYKEKKYEDEMKNTLSAYGNPFVISDKDKGDRVMLGIFTEGDAAQKVKELTDKNVSNSKMTFEMNNNDVCNAEIIEIVNGNLLVLTKLMDKTVQSVNSQTLKDYCTSLKAVDKSSPNYSELNELKEYVKNLPQALTKDKAADNYVFIYNLLKKITSK